MDHDRRHGHHYVNGMTRPVPVDRKKDHNYKLIVDPFLHKGHPQKVYRFDGVVPGENRVVSTRDPRSRLTRLWTRQQQADLPVPKFKYDEYYVGIPPPKDVTFTNLNDNINKDFLENMCKGFGKIEECKIYYHPRTKKHLSVGKTLFTSSKAAKACVDKLNNTSKMGNIINVFIDTMGKERNRLIEELTSEQPRRPERAGSPGRRNSRLSDSSFADMEAYDPGDTFDLGHGEQDYTPSVETEYSSYSEGGYSVPQSEMSFSSQDTGYSSTNSGMNMGYHREGYSRDGYNHYAREPPPNTSHHSNSYYHGQQYTGGNHHQHHPPHHQHRHQQHHPHHQQRHHVVHHQPPATPAHRHTPQATPHFSMMGQDMDNSQYGFYAPPPPIPKPPFDRPPPPLPPEPQPPPPDHGFQQSHHAQDHSRLSHSKNKKKRSREPKQPPPPPRQLSPEPNSDEPRMESLESRIQSLLQNVHGMGSPDHTSSSSQDEATPSHSTAHESPFDFHPPPAAESLPPLPELTQEDLATSPAPGQAEDSGGTGEEFESQVSDSQTVIEETVNTEPSATPNSSGLQNGLPTSAGPTEGKSDIAGDDEDDRMSLSSISSGEEKLEINPPLPSASSVPSTSTNFTPPHAAPPTSSSTVTSPWAQYNYGSMMGSPPLGGMHPGTYQNGMYGMSAGHLLPTQEEKEDPNDKTFTTVLDKFIKELKIIMQKDLCKKMVENSAFKAFEAWWDGEVLKSKTSQQVEKIPEVVSSTSTSIAKPKTDIKPEMSASLASLFESRDRGGLDNSSMGCGGFLGIRGGMPKLPSFKRKFPRPSSPPEGDEDSRKVDAKSIDDEESDEEEESAGSKQKPLISESEEESESSDEEKEEASADEDSGDEEGSEDSSEEEEEEESEDSSEEEEEDSEMEESSAETPAKPQDQAEAEVKVVEDRVEEKMEMDKSDDEEEEVDVGTEADISHVTPSDKDTSLGENEDSTEVSSMDTDEELPPKDVNVKDTPEKRPLSPILEDKEAEEQAVSRVKGDKSDVAETSATTTVSTDTTTTSTDSSAMDSDSSAVESGNKKLGEKGRRRGTSVTGPEKDSVSSELSEKSSLVEPSEGAETVITEDDTVCVREEIHDSESSHKLSESEAEQRSHFMVPAIAEHDYFSFPPVSKGETTAELDQTESADEDSETLSEVLVDHNYSLPPIVMNQVRIGEAVLKKESVISPKPAKEPKKKAKTKKSKTNTLADITNRPEDKVNRELASLLTPVKPLPKFKCRTLQEEHQIFFDIYDRGISEEDVKYLKRSYDELIQSDDPSLCWLNDILWVDHTHTDIPDVPPTPVKKRKKTEDLTPKLHKTGCARTEGYYKLTMMEKAGYLRHAHIQQKAAEDMKKIQESKKAQTSREARHHNRRLQTTYSDLETDLLRFNQLKFRKKQLKFAKSGIHDWGLFALEPIASEEMVIEYVGQVVRQSIADEREKRYEAIGIGSSYLFRVDTETIIDATKTGNLARFINHSCNPNCYAKIITVEAEKKIVIYSKRDIDVNEEITYDYKFPIEDEKIPCLCGAPGCRGTLN